MKRQAFELHDGVVFLTHAISIMKNIYMQSEKVK